MNKINVIILLVTSLFAQIENLQHSQIRKKLCAYNLSQDSNSRQLKNQYLSMLQLTFGQQNILDLFFPQQGQGEGLAGLTNHIGNFSLVIIAVSALIVISCIWSCLCCNCCCPGKCPLKCLTCCRKQTLTECQTIWPLLAVILFLCLSLASSIPGNLFLKGLLRGPDVIDTFGHCGCQIYSSLDDIQIGKLSQDKTIFWVGLNKLVTNIDALGGKIDNITNQAQRVFSNQSTSNITKVGQQTQALIQYLYGNYTQVTFSGRFNGTADPPTNLNNITTNYKDILGPKQQNKTVLGITYVPIKTAHDSFYPILQQLQSSTNNLLGVKNVNSSLYKGKQLIQSLKNSLSNPKSLIAQSFDNQAALNGFKTIILLFFILVIVISILGLVASLGILCFQIYKLRYILYAVCTMACVIAYIGIAIILIFSVIVPVIYHSCGVLEPIVQGKGQFERFFYRFRSMGFQDIAMASSCVKGEDGKIIEALNISDFSTTLNSLGNITSKAVNFDQTLKDNGMNFRNFTAAIDASIAYNQKFLQLQLLNINNQQMLSLFTRLKEGNYTSTGTNCGSNNNKRPQQDSIVPNFKNPQYPCKQGFKNCQQLQTCQKGSCISLYENIYNKTLNRKNVRYPDCNYMQILDKDLRYYYGNISKNLEDVKKGTNSLQKVRNSILNQSTSFDDLKGNLSNLQTSFKSIQQITDPTSGVLAGLNCKPIGQSIQIFVEYLCVDVFVDVFYTFIVMTVIVYALIIAMCCLTLAGVRAYAEGLLNLEVKVQ